MRFRWFVGLSAVLVATVGVTVVVHDRLEGLDRSGDQLVVDPAPGERTGESPGPGSPEGTTVQVAGTVSVVHLEEAVLQPRLVPAPLTLVSERGFGNGGELTGVEVGGRPSAVVWDGGRPFVLTEGAGLALDTAVVDLVPDGLRVGLGGGVHALEPGRYRLETPVAVGQAGVATPYDAVSFTAGPDARFEATGDTALLLGPSGPWRLAGPGVAHLEGDLQVTGPDGTTRVTRLALTGAYDLELAPRPAGGWTVSGLVRPDTGTTLSLD